MDITDVFAFLTVFLMKRLLEKFRVFRLRSTTNKLAPSIRVIRRLKKRKKPKVKHRLVKRNVSTFPKIPLRKRKYIFLGRTIVARKLPNGQIRIETRYKVEQLLKMRNKKKRRRKKKKGKGKVKVKVREKRKLLKMKKMLRKPKDYFRLL
jgi:hypothetical protein